MADYIDLSKEDKEQIKDKLRKGQSEHDISVVLQKDLDVVSKYVASTRQPKCARIDTAEVYNDPYAGQSDLPKYACNFQYACIQLGENDKLETVNKNVSAEVVDTLAKGKCSCPVKNNRCYNFLVLGQTGAGKSTLIDSLVNYWLGIRLWDEYRYKLIREDDRFNELNAAK